MNTALGPPEEIQVRMSQLVAYNHYLIFLQISLHQIRDKMMISGEWAVTLVVSIDLRRASTNQTNLVIRSL